MSSIKPELNQIIGKEKIRAGNVAVFGSRDDWLDSWKHDANLALLWDTNSETLIHTRVISSLQHNATLHHIRGWFATIDSPLHSTILSADMMSGTHKNIPMQERDRIFNQIATDAEMLNLCTALVGLEVHFDFLCNNGDNITLNCTEIPEAVMRVRERALNIYTHYNLPARPMDDFFHMTLMRLREIPEDNKIEQLIAFERETEKLHEVIRKQPIMVQAERLWFGCNMQDKKREEL